MNSIIRRLTYSILGLSVISTSVLAGPPTIGPQVRLDPGGGTAASNETTASAAETRPGVIIAGWNDWRRSTGSEIINAGFSLSFDAGKTWTDLLLRPPSGFQTSVEGDPMSCYDDRTGTLWGGAIAFGGSHLYVARLDNGSTQFSPSVVADSGSLDKCWMAAGPQLNQPNTTRVYIALNTGILWSDNMGQTWTNPTSLGSGIGFLPRVGPNGEVYVAYWDFGTGLRMKRSLNNGASFTTHTIATRMDTWGTQDGSRFPGNFRVPPLATLDVNDNTGELYACYFDTTNIVGGQRNVDIYFTRSTNQGTTWSTPVVINTDNNPPGDQFFSWIECDKQGRLHVVSLDSRHTVQNDGVQNGMFDAYYTYSEDNGATWHEHRLSPISFNSNNDGLNRGSSQFMGDYLGLATSSNKAYPVYLDSHTGDPDIYTNVVSFGESAELDSFEITRGTLISGDINSLRDADDSSMRIESRVGPRLSEIHGSELLVHTSTGISSPTQISVTVESRVDQPSGTLKVALRNWNTGQLDQIGTAPVNSTDARHTFDVNTNASDYVNGSGQLDIQVKHIVFAPLFSFTFDAFVDQVTAELN